MVEKTKKVCLSAFNVLTIVIVCVLGSLAIGLAFLVNVMMTLLHVFQTQRASSAEAQAGEFTRSTVKSADYRVFEPAVTDLRQVDKKAS